MTGLPAALPQPPHHTASSRFLYYGVKSSRNGERKKRLRGPFRHTEGELHGTSPARDSVRLAARRSSAILGAQTPTYSCPSGRVGARLAGMTSHHSLVRGGRCADRRIRANCLQRRGIRPYIADAGGGTRTPETRIMISPISALWRRMRPMRSSKWTHPRRSPSLSATVPAWLCRSVASRTTRSRIRTDHRSREGGSAMSRRGLQPRRPRGHGLVFGVASDSPTIRRRSAARARSSLK
jgi:hypothetical protein